MKKITFDEEELFAIAVFSPDTRSNTVASMTNVLPELEEDAEMHALLLSAVEKLKRISDQEYNKMDLDAYREEMKLEEEQETDREEAEKEQMDPGMEVDT